jgi:hypothetical protein
VASKLCRLGYEVAFTLGNNTPLADLIVMSPKEKRSFLVDVKGQRTKNFWLIRQQEPRDDLFYVLVYMPTNEYDKDMFFVLNQKQVDDLFEARARSGVKVDPPFVGFNLSAPSDFGDKWAILPR